MTRRDARIMARRLHSAGYRTWTGCIDGRYYLRVYDGGPGYYLLFCCPGRSLAAVLAWLGLSPSVTRGPDPSPAPADGERGR